MKTPMPRRSILSAAERESLLVVPDTKDDLIRYYTFCGVCCVAAL
jgi:hypothetical protein